MKHHLMLWAVGWSTLSSSTYAQDASSSVLTLSKADLLSIASEVGWSEGDKHHREDGDFTQTFKLSNGLPVEFEGLACDSDELPGCPEYQLSVTFGLGSPDRAAELASQLSYRWGDVWLGTDEAVVVSRMEFLYGGVSREHVKQTFITFEDIARDAAAKAFPCGWPVDGVEPSC